MAFYIVFPLFLIVMAFWGRKNPHVGKIVVLLMLFFSMFRGEYVGVDTAHYMDETSIRYWGADYELSDGLNFELVYIYLMRLLYSYGLSPRYVIAFYSVITILFLYLALKRFKVNVAAGALFFYLLTFYLQSFNAARQMAAVSLLLYATSFLLEEGAQKWKFWLWFTLATFTHTSAFLAIVMWFADRVQFNKKNIGIFVVVFCAIALVVPLYNIVTNILELFGSEFRYAKYGADIDYEIQDLTILGIMFKLIVALLLYVVFLDKRHDKKTDWLDNLLLLSMIVTSLFNYSDQVTKRVVYNFTIIQCPYLAMYFFDKSNKNTSKKRVIFWMFVIMLMYEAIGFSFNLGKSGYYLEFNLF